MSRDPFQATSRRAFMGNSLAGLAGLCVSGHWLGNMAYAMQGELDWRNKKDDMAYGRLGRTNFMMSRIAFGCGGVTEDSVRLLRAAFDKGINYLDTARAYREGQSEAGVGKFVKKVRDQLWITSKAPNIGGFPSSHVAEGEEKKAARMYREACEESLKVLDCEYIDCYFIHGINEPWKARMEPVYEEFLKLKEEGKVRFFGMSVHSKVKEVMAAALDTGWYDVMMPAVNPANLAEVLPELERAKKEDVGIVAMKTAGKVGDDAEQEVYGEDFEKMTGLNKFTRSYVYMLNKAPLAGCVSDITNFEMLGENTGITQVKLARADLEEFEALVQKDMCGSCHFCGNCRETCRHHLAINDVVRSQSYLLNYHDPQEARGLYAQLSSESDLYPCGDCTDCVVQCPAGIKAPELLRKARELFAQA